MIKNELILTFGLYGVKGTELFVFSGWHRVHGFVQLSHSSL